jgi:hypothetical protein
MKKLVFLAPIILVGTLAQAQTSTNQAVSNGDTPTYSKYAYYEASDENQRVVKPELIEKYRKARNNNTYVNLHPTDWAGIMHDRGLKPVKVKTKRVASKSNRNSNNGYNTSSNNAPNNYRPRGLFVRPIFGFGWNSRSGWTPNVGVVFGSRQGGWPMGTVTYGGRGNVNVGVSTPYLYYNNIYNQAQNYGNRYAQPYNYGNYYQNMYNYSMPQAYQQTIVATPTTVQTNVPTEQKVVIMPSAKQENIAQESDWANGEEGPEKYMKNVKKISEY